MLALKKFYDITDTIALLFCLWLYFIVSSKLSTIVSDLGLVTRLKYKLIAHKKETDRQNTLLHEEMDG